VLCLPDNYSALDPCESRQFRSRRRPRLNRPWWIAVWSLSGDERTSGQRAQLPLADMRRASQHYFIAVLPMEVPDNAPHPSSPFPRPRYTANMAKMDFTIKGCAMRASQKFMQGTIFALLLVLTGMAPSTTTRAQTAGAYMGAASGATTATTAAGAGTGAGTGASSGHGPIHNDPEPTTLTTATPLRGKHPPATHVVARSSSPSQTANIHAPMVSVHR
jgi:hypothetical protein